MKVLIAEDDPDIQVILRMVLTRLGKSEVQLISQGDQVVPKAREMKPDLILLDMMLPEKSGMEICSELKVDPQLKKIPVIFLTARALPMDIKEALSLGAVGYLAKPFDPMTLVSQINEIVTPLGMTLGAKNGQ